MVMVGACGGEKDEADDDTLVADDTDVGGDDTDVGGDDTDVGGDDTDAGGDDTDAGGDDTDAGGDDTDAGGDDTDVGGDDTDAGDSDPPGDTTPPVISIPSASDYTVFFDWIALNVYWRDASDDVTGADALEYQVTCQPPGQPAAVSMDWTVATDLYVEGSLRYWFPACSGAPGYYDVKVSVRDAAGNVADYPTLTGEIYLPPS
jgi:hypothetical protein